MKIFRLNNNQLRALYIGSFFLYGCIIAAIGPSIPYLSAYTNIPETQYSSFFSFRALGMVSGGALLRSFNHYYPQVKLHMILSFSLVGIGLTSILFYSIFSLNIQNILFFLSANAYCSVQISYILCLLKTCQKKDFSYWLLIQTSAFGIGALFAPAFVYFLELNIFNFLGIFSLMLAVLFFFLEEIQQKVSEDNENQESSNEKSISKLTLYTLALFMFMMIGIECNFSGWSSTFAVVTQISTIQHATIFPSLYFITLTVFRIAYTFLPGKNSQKLNLVMFLMILFQILSIILHKMDYQSFALYFNCLTGGIFMCPIYAVILSISSQFDLQTTQKHINVILIFGFAGEGVITWFCGFLMQNISMEMFYYFNLITEISMGATALYLLSNLTKERDEMIANKKGLQRQLIQYSNK